MMVRQDIVLVSGPATTVEGKTMPMGAPSARHAASTVEGGLVGIGEVSPGVGHWEGACPDCGGLAVYREFMPGQVVGACCLGTRCWWATGPKSP
jgi:hypothetical protein